VAPLNRDARRYILVLMLVSVAAMAGCAARRTTVSGSSEHVSYAFGPVYQVGHITDPLVAGAVARDASITAETGRPSNVSTSPATAAEVRGYLVQWANADGGGSFSLKDLVVMKDGSTYEETDQGTAVAAPRAAGLGPASRAEDTTRAAVVSAVAQQLVARGASGYASRPAYSANLVRIHCADGSTTDVFVRTDLSALSYNVKLYPWKFGR
jgi:hypothetical protein